MQDKAIKTKEFPFTIGILAERTGVPKSTLRDWVEHYKLISPIGYTSGNRKYPLFDARSVRIVTVIKYLRDQSYGIPIIKKRLSKELLEKLEDEIADAESQPKRGR